MKTHALNLADNGRPYTAPNRQELIARIEQLERALRPFVDAYKREACPVGDSDLYNEQPRAVRVTLGDCRLAARVL